jgi:hypothetical protein
VGVWGWGGWWGRFDVDLRLIGASPQADEGPGCPFVPPYRPLRPKEWQHVETARRLESGCGEGFREGRVVAQAQQLPEPSHVPTGCWRSSGQEEKPSVSPAVEVAKERGGSGRSRGWLCWCP